MLEVPRVAGQKIVGPAVNLERMATCIFDEDFKLKQFGRSAVQETYAWVNKENVPICNGLTVKSLRWLGFNVLIFN